MNKDFLEDQDNALIHLEPAKIGFNNEVEVDVNFINQLNFLQEKEDREIEEQADMEHEIVHEDKRKSRFKISDIKSLEVQKATSSRNKNIDLYGRSLFLLSKENCLRKVCTKIVGH